FYLHPEKRTERKVVHNSRALLLVDTSLSMGLHDLTATAVPASPNRLEQVAGVLDAGKFIDTLREKHDVTVSRFATGLVRVASPGKSEAKPADSTKAKTENAATAKAGAPQQPPVDWKTALVPQGTESRLGGSLRQLVEDERTTPVSAIVLFSD